MELTDQQLITLYQQYSEETWASGFMQPSTIAVADFRRWLDNLPKEQESLKDYELQFLLEYRRQGKGEM